MVVLVTGGTGRLGRLVVDELTARDHEVRVLTRHASPDVERSRVTLVRGDMATGAGLTRALAGVRTVVDVVNSGRRAQRVMVGGARLLLHAAAQAGVEHVVGIGIVGAEAVAPRMPYYRVKLAQEAGRSGSDV